LGSNRGSLSGLDWQDVNQAVVNLQLVLGGKIVLELLPEMRNGQWDLVIRAHRARPPLGAMDQPPLVSVSASCRALRYKELEAACMSALNMLDVACFGQNAYMPTKNRA
jgi:hypothetical protein